MPTTNEAVKPCPFCGYPGHIYKHVDDVPWVECTTPTPIHPYVAMPLPAWNTRHETPSTSDTSGGYILIYGVSLDDVDKMQQITSYRMPAAVQLLIESHDAFAFRLSQMDRLLATVPKWTYITNDPETWPPPLNTLMAKHCGGACWHYWVVLNPSQIDRQSWGEYWRVIPPPVTRIYQESEI